jgi:hypothetical protein
MRQTFVTGQTLAIDGGGLPVAASWSDRFAARAAHFPVRRTRLRVLDCVSWIKPKPTIEPNYNYGDSPLN